MEWIIKGVDNSLLWLQSCTLVFLAVGKRADEENVFPVFSNINQILSHEVIHCFLKIFFFFFLPVWNCSLGRKLGNVLILMHKTSTKKRWLYYFFPLLHPIPGFWVFLALNRWDLLATTLVLLILQIRSEMQLLYTNIKNTSVQAVFLMVQVSYNF